MREIRKMGTALERALRDGLRKHRIVGASAAVVTADGLAWEGHAGWARREGRRRPDAGTIWDWGSITKLVCGIAVLQLRDRRKLALSDPAERRLPTVATIPRHPDAERAIAIEDLLTHHSGLPNASSPDPVPEDEPWPLWTELEPKMARIRAEAVPGRRYIYSNLGFMLLGQSVERVARDEFESYAWKNVFMPLGMREPYFDRTPYHLLRRRAESYRGEGPRAGRAYRLDVDHGATTSNGGLKASLADMALFARWLAGGEVEHPPLARRTLAEMMRKRRTLGKRRGVGLAFHLEQHHRRWLVGHQGAAAGYRAALYVDPRARAALLVAANTDTAKPFLVEMARSFAAGLSVTRPLSSEARRAKEDRPIA